MDELQRAKITRTTQRTQATKLWNKAHSLMKEEMDETKLKSLKVMLETYDAKIEQLRQLDEQVSSKLDEEELLEAEIAEADDYLNELREKRYHIKFFIESKVKPSKQNIPPPSMSQTSVSTNSSANHRLPKLALPIFMGNLLKWQTFWDTFQTAIHNNSGLSDVQKFTYLKAQLSGDAANSIDGLPLTESNYAQKTM